MNNAVKVYKLSDKPLVYRVFDGPVDVEVEDNYFVVFETVSEDDQTGKDTKSVFAGSFNMFGFSLETNDPVEVERRTQ